MKRTIQFVPKNSDAGSVLSLNCWVSRNYVNEQAFLSQLFKEGYKKL